MPEVFDTLMLLALPASGKSEVRKLLSSRDPSRFHMGPTVQMDDYPYVHLQLCADEALVALGRPRAYHREDPAGQRNGPFVDPLELGALIRLLADDYAELRRGAVTIPEHAGRDLLDRFDRASAAAGAAPKLAGLPSEVRAAVADAIDAEARALVEARAASCPPSLDGRTLVIEFARGGPPGDAMPLPPGYGYAGSLPHLPASLLRRAAILYIWVDPADSRRKNRERARTDGHGSILFHGTPESVMDQEYARCDMAWLLETAPVPGTVRVESAGGAIDVPAERFDNRGDLTTFLRGDPATWPRELVAAVEAPLAEACERLWQRRVSLG